MAKIYRLLLTITTVIIFYNISFIYKDITALSIPDAEVAVVIEKVDSQLSTNKIFQNLQEYAEEYKIRFHKVAFGTDEKGKEVKKIFTFQPNNFSFYTYEQQKGEKVAFLSVEDLKYSSPKGTYYFSQSIPSDFIEVLANLGLEATIEPVGVLAILRQSVFSSLAFPSFVLLLLCFLSCFFYYCSLNKKIGIFHLLGKPYWWQVVKSVLLEFVFVSFIASVAFSNGLSWRYALVLLAVFAIILIVCHGTSFLITFSFSSTVEKIKGRKPYQQLLKVAIVFKLILVLCFAWLMQQTIHQVATIGRLRDGLSVWQKTEDVYRLSFSGDTNLLPDMDSSLEEIQVRQERANQVIGELTRLGEKSDGILAISNENHLSASVNYLVSHPFLVVNPHYLSAVPVLNQQGKQITAINQDHFILLIPEEQMRYKEQIENEVREWIYFNQHVDGVGGKSYAGSLEIQTIKGYQKLFHFDVEQEQPYSNSPVVLIFPLSLWGKELDTLVAEVSQGHYLFKNPDIISNYLTEHHLQEEFTGLTSSRELGMDKLKDAEKEQGLQFILLTTLVLSLVSVLYMVLASYIEIQKKKLFILHILGKTYREKHGRFLMFMIGGSLLLLIFLGILAQVSLWIYIGIVASELLLASLLIMKFEISARLDLLKRGE